MVCSTRRLLALLLAAALPAQAAGAGQRATTPAPLAAAAAPAGLPGVGRPLLLGAPLSGVAAPPQGSALGAPGLPAGQAPAAGALAAPASAALPGAAVGIPAALPAAAPGLLPENSGPAAEGAAPAAPPSSAESLSRLAAGLSGAQPGGPGGVSSKFFDQRRSKAGSLPAPADDGDVAVSPLLPPGIRRASVHTVRSEGDIDRLIPYGQNSHELIWRLKRELPKMAPYRVYTYYDALGGKIAAIDISQNPRLIDNFPEQHSHEIQLIKKIQLWNQDLQLIVREDGKTPDVVMGGVVTELKSLIGSNVDFNFLVNKANTQVLEHSRRHGLGHGAAVVDLTALTSVPVAKIKADLDAWQGGGAIVVLDKVFVFAGLDLKVFVRGGDGAYALQNPATVPFDAGGHARPISPRDVHSLQMLIKRGRFETAQRRLHALENGQQHAPDSPLAQARESLEGERLVGRLAKLVRRNLLDAAWQAWQNFASSHRPEAIAAIEPRVNEILPSLTPDDAPSVETQSSLFLRELEEPTRLRKAAGIKGTITVYGSARLQPGSRYYEEALKFAALVAKFGRGKIAIVTGGGGGIMEAANRGAFEAGGPSIGYNIQLPMEQQPNPFVTPGLSFNFQYFASRKIHLRQDAMALAYFPGGFGTLDELFEVLTLIQTGKMAPVPIVLVGKKEHWDELIDFEHLLKMGLISAEDLSLFHFAETAEEALSVIATAKRAKPL